MRFGVLSVLFTAVAVFAQQQTPSSTLSPKRAFEMAGIVVHALREAPMADVEVMIEPDGRPNEPQVTTTDSAGRFRFKDLLPGKFRLAARYRGFPSQLFDEHQGFATGIAVGPGKESEYLVFRLKPESSICGRISDEENEAVRSATVMLFARTVETGERTVGLLTQVESDDEGTYCFRHLLAGDYIIATQAQVWYAQHPPARDSAGAGTPTQPHANSQLDVAYPVTYYAGAVEPERAEVIFLHWGDHARADITLHAVPTVRLRISQDPARPIESASLRQTVLGNVVVDPSEDFTVDVSPDVVEVSGVAPGRYDVVATQAAKPSQMTSGVRHQAVNASENVDLDIHQSYEFATISGSVTFEGLTGSRPEMSLQFHNRETGQDEDIDLSPNGDFRNTELPPGRYEVILQNSDGYIIKSISTLNAKVNGQTIDIGRGVVRLALLTSKGTGQVDGVVMRDNKPVAGAMVILVPQDLANNRPLFRRDQSDSDGTFTLPAIASGKYTMVAIEDGWELEWANPAVLAAYLPKGRVVQVEAGSKLNVTVKSVAASAPAPSTSPTK